MIINVEENGRSFVELNVKEHKEAMNMCEGLEGGGTLEKII